MRSRNTGLGFCWDLQNIVESRKRDPKRRIFVCENVAQPNFAPRASFPLDIPPWYGTVRTYRSVFHSESACPLFPPNLYVLVLGHLPDVCLSICLSVGLPACPSYPPSGLSNLDVVPSLGSVFLEGSHVPVYFHVFRFYFLSRDCFLY